MERGGVIEIGIIGEPATLDPYADTASDLTYALIRPVFPMPYRVLPDGTIEAELAESLEITASSVRLTIARREWSNGQPITAKDVVASIRRATPPSGFAAIRTARAAGSRVIEMTGAIPDWEIALATGAFVLPRGRLTEGNLSGGPFRFSDYVRGRRLTYEPNPRAPVQPLLEGVTVSFVQGTELLIRLLENGDVHAAAIPSTVNLGERLDELGLSYDSATGEELVALRFDQGVSRSAARAIAAEINTSNLVASFVREEGAAVGTSLPENASALPEFLSVAVPEGDELLSLIQRALQLDLQASIPTVELLSAPVATLYGRWQEEAPADALLMRTTGSALNGARGRSPFVFPLATVATFIAWRDEVHGIAVNPSLEGPLWNAHRWWAEPSI